MDQELKNKLSQLAWKVTQEQGTEPPFSGEFNEFNESGHYHCICCSHLLFHSTNKFHSSCGWPAFHQALEQATIEKKDLSHAMVRTEILCKNCHAHLGHKFADGPFGVRYCINSVALAFVAQ